MQYRAKMMAVLIIAVMLFVQIPTAMATGGIVLSEAKAGDERGVSFEAWAQWHGSWLIADGETNDLIEGLLDAVKIKGSMGATDEGEYATFDIQIEDQSALSIQTVAMEDSIYLVSPLYPSPLAIEGEDEAMQILQNMIAYLEALMDMPAGTIVETIEALAEQSETAFSMVDMEAIEAMFMDLMPMAEEMEAWMADALAGEMFEGEVASVYAGVEIENAMLYMLTSDEIITFAENVLPEMKNSTLYWTTAFEMMEQYPTDDNGNPLSEAEFMDGIGELLDMMTESIVAALEEMDDIVMYYAECYDANGDVVTNMVHMIIPDEVTMYIEWPAEGSLIHMALIMGSEAYTLDILCSQSEADGEESQFNITFKIIEDDEIMGTIVFDVISVTTKVGNGTMSNARVLLGAIDEESGEEMGLEILLSKQEATVGGKVRVECQMDINVLVMDETMPIITFGVDVEKGEPSLPFDPASDMLFFYPGTLDEEAFVAWMTEDVAGSAMMTMLRIINLLPPLGL